jgi:hypothetical protein
LAEPECRARCRLVTNEFGVRMSEKGAITRDSAPVPHHLPPDGPSAPAADRPQSLRHRIGTAHARVCIGAVPESISAAGAMPEMARLS